jgi:hypothetical protein
MADEPFKASEEDWQAVEKLSENFSDKICRTIRELRDRVAALEAEQVAPVQVPSTTVPTTPVTSVQEALSVNGVFLGQNGLEGLADADSFWKDRPYGNRLYYGDGYMDYLHRDVLRSAIKLIEQNCATRPTHKPAPIPPAAPSGDELLRIWNDAPGGTKEGLLVVWDHGFQHGLAAGRAEQGTTPEPNQEPAGDRRLVDVVADFIGLHPVQGGKARAVILAVAQWLRSMGNCGSAADLEREARR